MIFDGFSGVISPIALSVLLIVYLMTVELGSPKIKKILIPVLIVLIVIFGVIFVQNIAGKW